VLRHDQLAVLNVPPVVRVRDIQNRWLHGHGEHGVLDLCNLRPQPVPVGGLLGDDQLSVQHVQQHQLCLWAISHRKLQRHIQLLQVQHLQQPQL